MKVDFTKPSDGVFAGRPVKKEISWKHDGEEFEATIYVRPYAYHSAVSDILSVSTKTDAIPGRIAACVCDEKGKSLFTAADVTGEAENERGPMSPGLTVALLNAITEVNGTVKPKRSQT